MARRYSRAASKDVKSAMHRRKRGTLKRGKGARGGSVKKRKQAIAIGLSEDTKHGKKAPKRRSTVKTRKRASEYMRGYRAANREKVNEHARKYRETHPEEVRESKRKWREKTLALAA